HVRLVAAVEANSLVVGHAGEWCFDLMSSSFECCREESLHYFVDAIGLGIRHLQIDLGELRLPIGPKILVAKAANDLKILVEPGDHQDLLEKLRGLGQRIERARLHAAGN